MRISVTTIESYRRYLNGIDKEENLIESITKHRPPTLNMQRGTAFHSILEEPEKWYYPEMNQFIYEGICFDADIVEKCKAEIDYAGLFEIKHTKVYEVSKERVTVVGKCDQLIGASVIENKTKWSGFDIDSYQSSYQWRFYLDIFFVDCVKYNVFCMSALKDGIRLNSIEKFEMHPYLNLHTDVKNILSMFVEYIHFRDLESFFQD